MNTLTKGLKYSTQGTGASLKQSQVSILPSETITKINSQGQQAFCLTTNDQDKYVVYISNVKEEGDGYEILKYVLVENQFDNRGQVAESTEEIFQLCLSGDNNDLIATIVEGFLIWPLGHGGVPGIWHVYNDNDNLDFLCTGLARLILPTEFRNVISRPSGSNSCVLNKSKDMAIAGVREFIFVWNIASEQLIKHFQGHYGRIIR